MALNRSRSDAASDGRFGALRLLIGIASGSGGFTAGFGLVLGGGVGTLDSVSLASGLTGPLRLGSGICGTTLTATDPARPPLISPNCCRGRFSRCSESALPVSNRTSRARMIFGLSRTAMRDAAVGSSLLKRA